MFDLGTRVDKGSSFIRPAGNSRAERGLIVDGEI